MQQALSKHSPVARNTLLRTPVATARCVNTHVLRWTRQKSTMGVRDPMTGEYTDKPNIDPSKLQIELTTSPRTKPPAKTLVFGRTFTDHMLSIPWTQKNGWETPRIHPYGPLAIEPSASVFHYALTLFEGLKAYRTDAGIVTLFRPDMNMKRMNKSATRIALPTFDGEALTELIKKLVTIDASWIPAEPGYSLYLRPTLIATQGVLGVGPADSALLFVIASPVGPYFKGGFKAVSIMATTEFIRAAPGGTGGFKLGANYGPTVVPQVEASKQGYDQNLWLLGPEHHLTEVGTMNMFIVLKKPDGGVELVTPPLEDIVLDGVTRDSILCLVRDHISGKIALPGIPKDVTLSVRKITMPEVRDASREGRLLEIFGAGTAAIVCPVKKIGYMGEEIHVPTGPDGIGAFTKSFLDEIRGRQLGKIPSDWCVVVKP